MSQKRHFDSIHIIKEIGGPKIEKILEIAKQRNIKVLFQDKDVLNSIAGDVNHQGIVALASEKEYDDFLKILSSAKEDKMNSIILLLDQVQDPQNFGNIIRTAEAFGVRSIIIPKRRSSGLTATVARSSSGALEYMSICRVNNMSQAMEMIKKEGFWIIGADAQASKSIYEFDFLQPVAIIIGGENTGLRPLIKENCDFLVKIPSIGKINSLNVASAAAIIISEAFRQKKIKESNN